MGIKYRVLQSARLALDFIRQEEYNVEEIVVKTWVADGYSDEPYPIIRDTRAAVVCLTLNESDRQFLLRALAVQGVESPGFIYACNEIAKRIDTVDDIGNSKMLYEFMKLLRPPAPRRIKA